MSKKNKTKDIVILSLMIITFLIVAGITLGLISSAHIHPTTPLTNDELVCYFTIDSTTDVNITWYRGTSRNISTTISCTSGVECNSSGSGAIPKEYTTKGESWTCEVGYYNGTGYEVTNTSSVTIGDTAPLEPKIYWRNNGTEITNLTTNISEDVVSNFTVNTTDADGDTISYSLNDTSFCSIPVSTVGNMSCNPQNESQLGPRSIKVYAESGSYRVETIFNINVTPTNDAPRFSPNLSNQNFTSMQIFNYYINIVDDENNTPYNLSIISVLDEDLNPGPILELIQINTTRFLIEISGNDSVTPSQALHNYTVKLMLNDTDNITFTNQSVNFTFQLIGITVNQLPTIQYRFLNVTGIKQGENLSIRINATDPDNNTLTFDSSNRILYNITWNSSTNYNSTVPNASFAEAEVNFTNLTNDHVVYRSFTVYVLDNMGGNVSLVINVTVENINDAPIINEISYYNNSYSNRNLSNLTGYTGVRFQYRINATDVDDLTYDNASTGLGTYTTNDTSTFYIDPNTGWLDFTINTSGNYSFIVNVTDRAGNMTSHIANITILPNQIPTFSVSPINISCNETDSINWPYSCYYNISMNVSDPDFGSGDNIPNYWTNSTIFTINSTTGIINFTVNQSMVGNYTILLNVTDSRGGMNSTTINLVINNTNNAPNMSYPDFPAGNWLVGNWYSITYRVSDLDLDLPAEFSYEDLNFTYNITGPNTSIFQFTKTDANTSVLLIQSSEGLNHDGNYTINMTVTDKYNNQSMRSLNITLFNSTDPPVLNQVIPTGTPLNNVSINSITWRDVSIFTSYYSWPVTNVSIYENKTYTFNITATPDMRYPNSLNYTWYYDGVLAAQTQGYQKYFNFFSNGTHNMTVVVTDQYNSSSTFTWYINITNVNRWPIYDSNSLQDLNISADTTIADYMTYQYGVRRFYDPDDDPTSGDYAVGPGHSTDSTTSLIFSSTTCEFATFSFPSNQLQITTEALGLCNVTFFARDSENSSMIVSSDDVLINITNITQTQNNTVVVPITVQSTGGGTNTEPTPIPYPLEVEKPKPLSILTPKLVTTYKNSTIKIPIVINNTWNGTLVGIMLEAYTNSTNVSMYLDRMYIPKLNQGESEELTLYVRNYKNEGHYEIQVKANVTVPEYTDTATIFINSAEMRSEGQEVENKISFAQDLLSSNPECQELSELLVEAKKELINENYAQTAKMVDNVINGCKYLVNNAKKNEESPSRNFIKTFEWKKSYNDYIIIGLFGVLFLASLFYILKKDNPEQDF